MMDWPADVVERRAVASLEPYAKNARTHSAAQIGQIAASIKTWGWTMPVLIDEAGTIIAGHARVMAAIQLGLVDVPTMVARDWSDEQKRAYVIADNRLGLNAGWDDLLLSAELKDLAATDFDIELIGFSPAEFAALTSDQGSGLTDPDEVPEVQALAISEPGDLWQLGDHRLVCGDATDGDRGRGGPSRGSAVSDGDRPAIRSSLRSIMA